MRDEVIKGVIERIVYKNRENGYYVLSVKISDKSKEYTVTGNHVQLTEGVSYEFTGQWKMNPKFGNQFAATKINEVVPSTGEAMIKYLSSNFFKGIGIAFATKIVKHFGEQTYDIIKKDIERLSEVPGVSKKKLAVIQKSWKENGEINEIMVFLQSYNISTLFSVKIYEIYGRDTVRKVRGNPYSLTDNVKGIGFKNADSIALDLGFAKDSDFRIASGIKHVLNQNENDGHCYMTYKQLCDKTIELLEVRLEDKIEQSIKTLIEENEIKLSDKIEEEKRYYTTKMFYNERYVAQKIDILKSAENVYDANLIEDWLEDMEKKEFKLSQEQIDGVLGVIENGVSVLRGSAGTGKTTTLKYFIELLKLLKIDFTLCSPTGRAAVRMTELTGCASSTIHRLLGVDFIKGGFIYNEENQLNVSGFLIIDESSMIDIHLASDLLRAVPPDCQVLFIGDPNQLPSVSSGNFFRDLIDSKFVNIFKLNKIFRQGRESEIIKFAHEINQGIEPQIYSPLIDPELWKSDVDCMFIDSDVFDPYKNKEDYPDWSSLHYGIDMIEMIRRLYVETISKYYGKETEIQILTPQNIGAIGGEKLSVIIQDSVNPASPNKAEIKIRQINLRVNDKVLQTKNNYELNCMNGDIGKIISINPDTKEVLIEFGNEAKQVLYKRDNLLELKLAYCVTIHKFQGSEVPIVIIPLHNSNYNLLFRNLLYTGITRGSKLVVFVGQRTALQRAVNNNKIIKRQTSLTELLQMKG